eukprot:8139979-Pyramimonas_sp.AAC.1
MIRQIVDGYSYSRGEGRRPMAKGPSLNKNGRGRAGVRGRAGEREIGEGACEPSGITLLLHGARARSIKAPGMQAPGSSLGGGPGTPAEGEQTARHGYK